MEGVLDAWKDHRAFRRVVAQYGSSRPLAVGVDVVQEQREARKLAEKKARRKGKGKVQAPSQLWMDGRGRMVRQALGHSKAGAKQVRKATRKLEAAQGGANRFLDGKIVSRDGEKFV